MSEFHIKVKNSYVRGVVGAEIHLTLWERICALFSGTWHVVFIDDSVWKDTVKCRNVVTKRD